MRQHKLVGSLFTHCNNQVGGEVGRPRPSRICDRFLKAQAPRVADRLTFFQLSFGHTIKDLAEGLDGSKVVRRRIDCRDF